MEFDFSKIGWLTIWFDSMTINILPVKEMRTWGYKKVWNCDCVVSFGFGPLIEISWLK